MDMAAGVVVLRVFWLVDPESLAILDKFVAVVVVTVVYCSFVFVCCG